MHGISKINRILLISGIAVFLIGYFLCYVTSGNNEFPVIIKTSMKVIEVLIFFTYLILSRKSICRSVIFPVFAGFFIYCCADIIINFNTIAGMVLFALGHIPFMILFFKIRKPLKPQLLIWGAIVAVVAIGVIISKVQLFPLGITAVIYSAFVSGVFVLSIRVNKLLAIGTGVFAFSDACIAIRTLLFKDSFFIAVIISVTYYFALVVMADYFINMKNRE